MTVVTSLASSPRARTRSRRLWRCVIAPMPCVAECCASPHLGWSAHCAAVSCRDRLRRTPWTPHTRTSSRSMATTPRGEDLVRRVIALSPSLAAAVHSMPVALTRIVVTPLTPRCDSVEQASLWTQFTVLSWRHWINNLRNPGASCAVLVSPLRTLATLKAEASHSCHLRAQACSGSVCSCTPCCHL